MSALERVKDKIKTYMEGKTLVIDFGEIPPEQPAVLVFPENTPIRIKGVDHITSDGQEFLAINWNNNGEGMTWGYLSLPDKPYFKALNDPIDVRDLEIINPAQ
jgi:hypothetical protein